MTQVSEGVCTICAIQLWEHSPSYTPIRKDKNTPSDWSPFKWIEDHILLSGPTWSAEEKGLKSIIIPVESAAVQKARVYSRGQATISSTGLKLMDNAGIFASTLLARLWRKKAINSPASKNKTVADLGMKLDRRCVKASDDGTTIPLCLPHIPNNKPGEPIDLGVGRYYIPWQAICTEESVLVDWSQEWWDHDPISIPHLTEALMSNLKRVESSSTHDQFATSFNNLPPEIEDIITSFLKEGSTSLECTYLMLQSRWKDILSQVPFLWDLETDIIEAKQQETVSGSFEWNWEKLARQVLSAVPIFVSDDDDECDDELENPWSYQTVGLAVLLGLTNRKRIWQILVDMYPNDVGMVHCLDEKDEYEGEDQDVESES
ncbi:hypothetical protein FSPOR_318 [Fusarium sporotrichioides]|uniref:Uncharacterized protein n=1 Tax=Fusarium sporotrichioides TaxID=5514 RepID=A0A395SW78_FUSSP|nr:hypothetical protein FSPOR_318 [Fusarium sporotrichioides]